VLVNMLSCPLDLRDDKEKLHSIVSNAKADRDAKENLIQCLDLAYPDLFEQIKDKCSVRGLFTFYLKQGLKDGYWLW